MNYIALVFAIGSGVLGALSYKRPNLTGLAVASLSAAITFQFAWSSAGTAVWHF